MAFISVKIAVALFVLYFIAVLFLVVFKPWIFPLSFPVIVLYLLIISSFFGAAIFNVKIGPVSLFPYRMLYIVMVFVFALYFIKEKTFLDWENNRIKPVLLFHLFWLFYACASLAWVRSLKVGLLDFIFLAIGVSLIFFAVFLLNERKHFLHIFYIWILMFTFLILIGLWNHFTRHHLPISRINVAPLYQQGIPTAVFVNENDYASFIAVSFFFLLAFIHRIPSFFLKGIGFIVLVLSLYVLLLTSSRANDIAIGLGVLVWFLFLTDRLVKKRLIIAGTGALILFREKALAFFSRFEQGLHSLNTAGNTSVDIRTNLIKNSLFFFEKSFGFGIGSGNAEFYLAHFSHYPTGGIINVHNWWVEILVNYGMFVFVGYLLIYIWTIVQLCKLFQRTLRYEKMVCEGLIGGMIAFSFSCISPSSQISLNYLWLLFAFSFAFIHFQRKKDLSNELIRSNRGVNHGQAFE